MTHAEEDATRYGYDRLRYVGTDRLLAVARYGRIGWTCLDMMDGTASQVGGWHATRWEAMERADAYIRSGDYR
jgi:hypothetical protein